MSITLLIYSIIFNYFISIGPLNFARQNSVHFISFIFHPVLIPSYYTAGLFGQQKKRDRRKESRPGRVPASNKQELPTAKSYSFTAVPPFLFRLPPASLSFIPLYRAPNLSFHFGIASRFTTNSGICPRSAAIQFSVACPAILRRDSTV